jgi:hypothetical protein
VTMQACLPMAGFTRGSRRSSSMSLPKGSTELHASG